MIKNDKINNVIIKFSFLLSCIYIIIQFVDSIFFFPINLGDEWYFTRDLNYFLKHGYYDSVIRGISIPFTLLSSFIHFFLSDISISLRFANAGVVFLLFLYLLLRKDLLKNNNKLVFATHALVLIGTTGGIFYGTNDSFLFISYFILCSETYLYLKRIEINKFFLVIIFSICILSRPHFLIYFPILFFSLYTVLFFRDGLNKKNFFNPILLSFFTSFLIVLLFNYPKLLENNFSHSQGDYLPEFLFFSYSDKSDTYKTEDKGFNWIQWCFYSQMVSENKKFGLFAPFVDWEDVRKYKLKNDSLPLPNSYQEYIFKYPSFVFKRIPFSFIEVFFYSLRYVGILLIFIPFCLIFSDYKKYINFSIFIIILTFTGIFLWAVIMPNSIAQQRLMPFYLMLLILATDKKLFISNNFNKSIVILNLIIVDLVVSYAFFKWGIFRSL